MTERLLDCMLCVAIVTLSSVLGWAVVGLAFAVYFK